MAHPPTVFGLAFALIAGACSPGGEAPAAGSEPGSGPAPAALIASATVPGAAQPAGHARMLALLEEVRVSAQGTNIYLGFSRIESLRADLANLPADDGEPSDQRRWRLTVDLGTELLRVGKTEEAITTFTAAVDVLAGLGEKLHREKQADAYFKLGTAHLRLGETQNCCLKNNEDSCILPIRDGGLHEDRTGSENAIQWLLRALDTAKTGSPTSLKARWLLNIAHMTLGSYPDGVPAEHRIAPETFGSETGFPRFVDIAPQVGLGHVDLAGGAIADDFDDDGLLDLVISTSNTAGVIRYYANDGSGVFVERTEEANFSGIYGGLNTTSADYDNDGDVDILVLRGAWWKTDGRHPKSLLQNDGHGVFTDVTFDVGLGGSMFPTQTASFADYDNDGDLDLYIGNEDDPTTPAPCELYRNDGGRFTDVAAAAGVTNDRYTKAVIFGDYDGDRYPDIYVSNMGALNRLYHNQQDGTFRDVAPQAQVGLPLSSFPAWFFDYDNDGALDIYVAGFGGPEGPPNVADVAASYLGFPHQGDMMRLYKGDGRGGFRDVGKEVGFERYTLPMGSNFGDLDHDGFLDIYLGTGYPLYEGLVPNVMYRNERGQRFTDVTTAGGFGQLQKGHSISFADLDNDGDQDVVERVGGAYLGDGYRCTLYENPGFGTHWLKVKLVGTTSNRCGIGVRLRADIVEDGTPRSVYKWVNTGGSFGCNPLQQELGLGHAQKIERLEVWWPTSDTRQVFEDVAVDQALVVREGQPQFERRELRSFKLGK